MKRIAVLGTGLVGRVIAQDLASDPEISVLAVDRNPEAVAALAGLPRVETRTADLSLPQVVAATVKDVDAVALAVPGFLGSSVLRAVIKAGRPVVDISFSPEDPAALFATARDRGVPAIVDCGVAPGLSNLLVGRSAAEFDEVVEAEILVGGLPARRVWPYEYRIVFSPTDVIEEYTRPCRYREHGVAVTRPALSEVELVDLPGIGTLEAFNTDGLRSLLTTIPAPTLKEKTLRYPGHAERMRMLRETGFFEETPMEVDGVSVSPRALSERLLFRAWRPVEGETELTVMRVTVEGVRAGRRRRIVWDLLDRTDPVTRTTSMARTTGFPCAIVARLLLRGEWTQAGVFPPEILGRDPRLAGLVLDALAKRGVSITRREEDCLPG
jgi:lysine 6-dehydrogenase